MATLAEMTAVMSSMRTTFIKLNKLMIYVIVNAKAVCDMVVSMNETNLHPSKQSSSLSSQGLALVPAKYS